MLTRRLWRLVAYSLLILMALIFLIPVYMVIVTSLKNPIEAGQETTSWNLPTKIYWESFSSVWKELAPNLRNSALLVTGATTISALVGSMNGYVLAKWRIRGASFFFPLMLFGMFIPYQAIIIPLFKFMDGINLYGGIPGLVLVHVVYGIPITTLIFRNFYIDIPNELLEAGAIDGAGFFGIYTKIVFPLSLPGFVVVVIWQFTQIWNEFLFAVTLVKDKWQPITVPLAETAGGIAVKWNQPMAAAILAAIPTLFVYIVMGRWFIRGLLAGSIKG
ncbi:MAG: carbohydrate ABC transporter permease [Chloroflexi bacterium]|nr:carbohydrate ABC transporter permease [Chloroflexota bacterium]